MKKYWYLLKVNPEPWKVGPVGAARNAATGRVKGYVGRDQQLHSYKEAIKELLGQQPTVKVEGKFSLTIFFWREQTAYTTELQRKQRKHEADGTNLYKATEDACQGILFDNDRDNVNGQFFMMEQGPDAEGKVLLCLQEVPRNVTHEEVFEDMLVDMIPDQLMDELYPSAAVQLALELEKKKDGIDADSSEYSTAEPIF